jgi:hypothetical protein
VVLVSSRSRGLRGTKVSLIYSRCLLFDVSTALSDDNKYEIPAESALPDTEVRMGSFFTRATVI